MDAYTHDSVYDATRNTQQTADPIQQCTRAAEIRPLEVGIVAVVFSAADGGGCMMHDARAPPCDTKMLCYAARPTGMLWHEREGRGVPGFIQLDLREEQRRVEHVTLVLDVPRPPAVRCVLYPTRALHAARHAYAVRCMRMPRVCCMLYVHAYFACHVVRCGTPVRLRLDVEHV